MSEPTQTTAPPQSADEPGIEVDDTNATAIVVIGLVSTVLVLASALGVTALYDGVVASLTNQRVAEAEGIETDEEVEAKEQVSLLTDQSRVNPPQIGGYAIPIDRAMSLVVAEMRAEQEPAETETN